MRRPWLSTDIAVLAAGLGAVLAQSRRREARKMVQGYDLLEAGKWTRPRQFYEEILQQDPGNPLALNNLAAIMVKKKKYQEALSIWSRPCPGPRVIRSG